MIKDIYKIQNPTLVDLEKQRIEKPRVIRDVEVILLCAIKKRAKVVGFEQAVKEVEEALNNCLITKQK